MSVAYRPPRRHECAPGWTWVERPASPDLPGGVYGTPPTSWDYPAGTVWECECGRLHVSTGAVAPNAPGIVGWRRAGIVARWRHAHHSRLTQE